MANYTFLDATGATKTAASSTIGGVEYQIVKVPDVVSVTGQIQQFGTTSISGVVNINSVVGTYPEDSQHSTNSQGFFVMGVRNDTLSSMVNLDLDYTPITTGPSGEVITANAPITKWVSGVASVLTGAAMSQQIIAAQGASIFTYATALQFANFGVQSVLVAITAAAASAGSILGYVSVPANNTIPVYSPNGFKSGANQALSVSVIGANVPSLYVSAQGFISKT